MLRMRRVEQAILLSMANLLMPSKVLLAQNPEPAFDLVIEGARVIDPESHFDGIRNVGISGGTVVRITEKPLHGKASIQAQGLVAAPGFIDLHSHGQNEENDRARVLDGVTSAFDLELGVTQVMLWYDNQKGKRFVNYGVSVGVASLVSPARISPEEAGTTRASSSSASNLAQKIDQGLREGAVGVGVHLGRAPNLSDVELLEAFKGAAAYRASLYLHMRNVGNELPATAISSLDQAIGLAAMTGAVLTVGHVCSNTIALTAEALFRIRLAQSRSIGVFGDCHPYQVAAGEIADAEFEPGWQKRLGIGYADLSRIEDGSRLDQRTFDTLRRSGKGRVLLNYIPEAAILAALKDPETMVISDGLLINGRGHPRSSGAFARVLGHYVRDRGVIDLSGAIRKMTLLPARLLEMRLPQMRTRGRLREGMTADITLFDPAKIADRATWIMPKIPSEGIKAVIVNGTIVALDGRIVARSRPGLPMQADVR